MRGSIGLLALLLGLAALAVPVAFNGGSAKPPIASTQAPTTLLFDENNGEWTFFEERTTDGKVLVYGAATKDGILLTSYYQCFSLEGGKALAAARQDWSMPENYYAVNVTVEIRLKYSAQDWHCPGRIEFTMGRHASGRRTITVDFTVDPYGNNVVIVAAGTGQAATAKANPGEWVNITLLFHRSKALAEIYVETESGENATGYGWVTAPDDFSRILISGRLPGIVLLDYIMVRPFLVPYETVTPGGG